MYFALGLLVAGLMVLLVAPAVWRRAVRLTRARIEASVPMTRAEVEADKDRLRADFAISTRRLELTVGQLNEKLSLNAVDMARRQSEIAALTATKESLTTQVAGLEQQIVGLNAGITDAEAKLAEARSDVALRDDRLVDSATRLAKTEANLETSRQSAAELRLEMVARNTHVGNLDDRIDELAASEAELIATRERLIGELADTRDRMSAELAAERESLAAERQRVVGLEAGLGALHTERTERLAELERRGHELKALETDIAAERVRREALLADLEQERERTGGEMRRAEELTTQLSALELDRTERDRHAAQAAEELRTLSGEIAAERQRAEAERGRAEGLMAEVDSLQAQHAAHHDAMARTGEQMQLLSAEADRHRQAADTERERAENFARELGALQAELGRRHDEIARLEREAQALAADVATERQRVAETTAAHAAAAGSRDELAIQLDRHKDELRALNAELFDHVARQEDLEKRSHDAEMALSDTKAELVSLRIRHQADVMVGGDTLRKAAATAEHDKRTLAEQLAALEREHATLVAENAELRRMSGAEWESDRRENQQLRDRLNDIAANVVRLTQTIALNGNGDAMPGMAADGNGRRPAPAAPPTAPQAPEPVGAAASGDNRTLAERLRALQHAGARH